MYTGSQLAYTHAEEAASPAMRVTVVPPLPLLMATIDRGPEREVEGAMSPPRSPTAGDRRTRGARRAAYCGEKLEWQLVLENIGKHAIERVRVGSAVAHHGREGRIARGRGKRGRQHAVVTVGPHDNASLAAGQETRLALTVQAGEGSDVSLDVVVEYVGAFGAAEANAIEEGRGVLGRRLKVPIALKLQPLVRVVSVRIVPRFDAARQLGCALEAVVVAAAAERPISIWLDEAAPVVVHSGERAVSCALQSCAQHMPEDNAALGPWLLEQHFLHWALDDGRTGAVRLPREMIVVDEVATSLLRGLGACTTVSLVQGDVLRQGVEDGEPVVHALVNSVLVVECINGGAVLEDADGCAAVAGVVDDETSDGCQLQLLCVKAGSFIVAGTGGRRCEWLRVVVVEQ